MSTLNESPPGDAGLVKWVQTLGPVLVIAVALASAWGSFDVRMGHMESNLNKLDNIPLTLERMRNELTNARTVKETDYEHRLSALEGRAAANRKSVERIWDDLKSRLEDK